MYRILSSKGNGSKGGIVRADWGCGTPTTKKKSVVGAKFLT